MNNNKYQNYIFFVTTSPIVKHQKSEIGLSFVKVNLLFGILIIISRKHHVNNNIVLPLN